MMAMLSGAKLSVVAQELGSIICSLKRANPEIQSASLTRWVVRCLETYTQRMLSGTPPVVLTATQQWNIAVDITYGPQSTARSLIKSSL